MTSSLCGSRLQRRFSHLSRAWYASANLPRGSIVDEIRIGLDWVEPENGCEYEFLIVWHELGRERVPQVTMFNDSWRALREMPELFEWLAEHEGQHVTPAEVGDALRAMGVLDNTAEVESR